MDQSKGQVDNSNLEELQMAKKRDHKIMITDIAIEKVPYINYKGIPEEEYEIIRELAKSVLRIAKENNNSDEVAITYSMDVDKLEHNDEMFGISFGDEHTVNPLEDTLSYHLIMSSTNCVILSLHNHPSLSKISLADVQFFIKYDSIKMIVIITNLGSIFYMVKTDKYNKGKAIDLYNKAVDYHYKASGLKGYQNAADQFINECFTVGIIHEDH